MYQSNAKVTVTEAIPVPVPNHGKGMRLNGLHVRRCLNIGTHLAHLVVFLRQIMEQDVAQGDYRDHVLAFADGQVAEPVTSH